MPRPDARRQPNAERLQSDRRGSRADASGGDRSAARGGRAACRSPVCRLPSRTTSVRARHADHRLVPILDRFVPPHDAAVVQRIENAARSSSARRTATSLRWGRRMRTPRSAPCTIRGRPIAHPVVRGGPPPRCRLASIARADPTQVDPSGSRPRFAAWSALSQRMAE